MTSVCLACSLDASGQQHLRCPQTYPSQRAQSAIVESGWVLGRVGSPGSRLQNAGALDGAYTEIRAELRGQDRRTKNGSEHRFVFGAREKWIYCGYGGQVELLHRVDATAQECVIRYRTKSKGMGEAISVRCF